MRVGRAPVPIEEIRVLCPCVLTLPVCPQHPTDVDYRVMATFTEFYTTLLGFVNFRLYQSLNLVYPPKVRPPPALAMCHAGPSRVRTTWSRAVGEVGEGQGGVWGLSPHLTISPQIDGQADVELKPVEGTDYAMDSESCLEVRDAAVTRGWQGGSRVVLVSCLQPFVWPGALRTRSLHGGGPSEPRAGDLRVGQHLEKAERLSSPSGFSFSL